MKMKSIVATVGLLSLFSSGAFAANSISADQTLSRESLGIITVSAIGSSPMDMRAKLDKKAAKHGASSYHIIEARTGSHWHTTAELYK